MSNQKLHERHFDVPPEVDPVRCPECNHPFATERLCTIHRGMVHTETLDEAERRAFEEAYESESEQLRVFRLKALIALIVLYFVLLMAYALV